VPEADIDVAPPVEVALLPSDASADAPVMERLTDLINRV
jgi:hypothetical protein